MKALLIGAVKGAAKRGVGRVLDEMRERAVLAVQAGGPPALDKVFDGSQSLAIRGLEWLIAKPWTPKFVDELLRKIEGEVQRHGDALQDKAKRAAVTSGPVGVAVVFAEVRGAILAAIERA